MGRASGGARNFIESGQKIYRKTLLLFCENFTFTADNFLCIIPADISFLRILKS